MKKIEAEYWEQEQFPDFKPAMRCGVCVSMRPKKDRTFFADCEKVEGEVNKLVGLCNYYRKKK